MCFNISLLQHGVFHTLGTSIRKGGRIAITSRVSLIDAHERVREFMKTEKGRSAYREVIDPLDVTVDKYTVEW